MRKFHKSMTHPHTFMDDVGWSGLFTVDVEQLTVGTRTVHSLTKNSQLSPYLPVGCPYSIV